MKSNNFSNIPRGILNKIDNKLYHIPSHPIATLKNHLQEFY